MPSDGFHPPSFAARPRILVVCRRSIRKNKYIDYVGEYHLDLLLRHGALPIILPRLPPTSALLSAYAPIHGVLLAEGEDIGATFRTDPMTPDLQARVRATHPSDADIDHEKDRVEFALARLCVQRGIPLLGICRGSQIANVVGGGSLLADVDAMVPGACKHIDYANYDAHRHAVRVVPDTPLSEWFQGVDQLAVNSYHHQGIGALAPRFRAMAYAPDGLVEAFYDAEVYAPEEGKFLVGLQFHPERMQNAEQALQGAEPMFDYAGCPRVYQAFVRAATVYAEREMRAEEFSKAVHPAGESGQMRKKKGAGGEGLGGMFCRSRSARVGKTCAEDARRASEGVLQIRNTLAHVPGDENQGPYPAVVSSVLGGAAFLTATERLSGYSKEDLKRLVRSGATVHGAQLVQQLLRDGTDLSAFRYRPDGRQVSRLEWTRFHENVKKVEEGLAKLRGSPLIEEAMALVRKLSPADMKRKSMA